MADLPIPEFYDRDVNEIVADMVAFYAAQTGRDIHPADPEMLVINMCAYREFVLRNANNDACLQNLLRFSRYPYIDYIAELFNVTRLPAASATCTMEFTIITGHGSFIIPQGTRVSTSDGNSVFTTDADIVVAIGTDIYTVFATAQDGGATDNGYAPGTVITLIDVLPSVTTVTNLDTTAGGSDEETDDQLRDRIKLAPSTFSVAGPRDAYKFFAFSAHPTIEDVAVTNPVPGVVNIYVLSSAGVPTPAPILSAVNDLCSGERVRPICDTVQVLSPTFVPYNIEVEAILYNDANQPLVETSANDVLNQFPIDNKKLGRDIIRNKIISLLGIEGIYDINLIQPGGDIVLSEDQFALIGTVTFTVIGFNNG